MTQLRKCKCGISNYFDELLAGIGHRGSSFSDLDAVSHDVKTGRFLIQEFKQDGEPLSAGQHWMLTALSQLPRHFTVWQVVKREDGLIGFGRYGETVSDITVTEYQERFAAWWANKLYQPSAAVPLSALPKPAHPPIDFELKDTDYKW